MVLILLGIIVFSMLVICTMFVVFPLLYLVLFLFGNRKSAQVTVGQIFSLSVALSVGGWLIYFLVVFIYSLAVY
jgi:hypothetical protein